MDGNSHEEKHELEDMKLGGECFRKDSFSTSSKEETLYTRWNRYFKEAWEGIIAYKCPHRDTFQNIVRE